MTRRRSSQTISSMALELIERVSALDFKHIRQMDIPTFIRKYREFYLHTLVTMPDDDDYGYAKQNRYKLFS